MSDKLAVPDPPKPHEALAEALVRQLFKRGGQGGPDNVDVQASFAMTGLTPETAEALVAISKQQTEQAKLQADAAVQVAEQSTKQAQAQASALSTQAEQTTLQEKAKEEAAKKLAEETTKQSVEQTKRKVTPTYAVSGVVVVGLAAMLHSPTLAWPIAAVVGVASGLVKAADVIRQIKSKSAETPVSTVGVLVDEPHRRVASRIRQIAKERKIVLPHVPDRAVLSQAQFWNILAGKHSPTLRVLVQIAGALGVDVAELLAGASAASKADD